MAQISVYRSASLAATRSISKYLLKLRTAKLSTAKIATDMKMGSALATMPSQPSSLNSTVLVVDDEQSVCDMLAAVLEAEGYTVVTANSGGEALTKFGEYIFDVMFTDICMEGMDGLELLSRVSQLDSSVKTIVMTAFSGYDTAVKALKGGAHDYLEKPLDNHDKIITLTNSARQVSQLQKDNIELLSKLRSQHSKLQSANKELGELNSKLEDLALTDGLTGLNNRRSIDTIYAQECSRYLRYKEPFTVAMIDVDHFKQYNDKYGHTAGDTALQFIASQLIACTRDSDSVGRYGGEEFFILLSNTAPENAIVVANRILESVRNNTVVVDGVETKLTVSIGLAGVNGIENMQPGVKLMEQSDNALYVAKSNGRDQMQLFKQDS